MASTDLNKDLVMLVQRMARELKKTNPDSDLANKALDFLKRNGLTGSPLRTITPQKIDAKRLAADGCFENYNFGDGVTVEAHNGWDSELRSDGSGYMSKVVFVKYDDDKPDDDTHRVTFYVSFNSQSHIQESFAMKEHSTVKIGFNPPCEHPGM